MKRLAKLRARIARLRSLLVLSRIARARAQESDTHAHAHDATRRRMATARLSKRSTKDRAVVRATDHVAPPPPQHVDGIDERAAR